MAGLSQLEMARILGSEIAGSVEVAHGPVGAAKLLRDAAALRRGEILARPVGAPGPEDSAVAEQAFRLVRNDDFSVDAWIADPARNARFLQSCRAQGSLSSDYVLNKALMNLRRNGKLAGLRSTRLTLDIADLDFCVQFAATKLRILLGASIDDIVCDPKLGAEFDRRAAAVVPDRSPLEYRWALLRARKRETVGCTEPEMELPEVVPLLGAAARELPQEKGVLLLRQAANPLFAQGTGDLQRSSQLLRLPRVVESIVHCLFKPSDRETLELAYQPLPNSVGAEELKARAARIAELRRPIFNVLAA